MKEIIYNIDGVAGRVITLTGLTGTFTKNNVLGIINKSQGDVLYTPMDWNLLTFAYSNGTMTLTLAESVAAIAAGDKLFVKLYSDGGGDSSDLVADFFGLVSDGETVKVVTEDGGEEVVEPVPLMDEDDVYDYLEYVAVNMGYITPQQAATITADTRAIIHGGSGSGSGSGSEGGSGSGSEGGAGE